MANIYWLLLLRECGPPAAFSPADVSVVVSLKDLYECLDMEE
jgi:hypothetical protein